MRTGPWLASLLFLLPAACNAQPSAQPGPDRTGPSQTGNAQSATPPSPQASAAVADVAAGGHRESGMRPFIATPMASFDEPWAMTFIGDGPYALVTERKGKLILIDTSNGAKHEITGLPDIDYGGQGGFGDVVMAPDSDSTDKLHPIYLSWVEAGKGNTRGAVVARADLLLNGMAETIASLHNLRIIWRQEPKVSGRGHFSHRIAVAPDGRHIFISSGERQKFDPAQDMTVNLGKILRLNLDGSVPKDNPFADKGGVTAQIWSLGHRNILGLAFDKDGNLWEDEMGPQGGDEVNLVTRGGNYGWPEVSNGSHYGGGNIPDHAPEDGFIPPKLWWNPSVSPSGMAYYNGALFPHWRNSLLVGTLSGRALMRLKIKDGQPIKSNFWSMQARIREVETGPDGAVWLLEDGTNGRLLKLTPKPKK